MTSISGLWPLLLSMRSGHLQTPKKRLLAKKMYTALLLLSGVLKHNKKGTWAPGDNVCCGKMSEPISAEKLVLHVYCHQLLFSWPTYQMSLPAPREWNPYALSTHGQATSSCSTWQFPQASTPNVRLHIIHWFLLWRTQQTIPASSNKDLGGAL